MSRSWGLMTSFTGLRWWVTAFLSSPSSLHFSAGFVSTQSLPPSCRSLSGAWGTAPLPQCAFIPKAFRWMSLGVRHPSNERTF